jgi:hypothetical protein
VVVKGLFGRELSDGTRQRVELAVAVAQERLLAAHVEHALHMVRTVGDRVPLQNVLAIYTRMLHLSGDEARTVTTRALATLGEKAARGDDWPEPPAEDEEPGSGRRSLLRYIRQRLRGRVDDELRRAIEFAVARAEVAILEVHVQNALQFIEIVDRETSATDAVELYLDALDVREGISEVVYHTALARLAEARPRERGAGPSAAEGSREPRLRVVDRERD